MNPAPQPLTWRSPTLLAFSTAALAAIAWFTLRAAASPADLSLAFIGWLSLLFLAATVLTITWSASPSHNFRSTSLGTLLLALTLSLIILCVGVGTKITTTPSALRLSLLLAAWLALSAAAATLLRRISPPFSVAATLALAAFFFAGPVTALPLLRAASPGSPAQRTIVHAIAALTPMLASLDAVKSSLLIEWAQLPQMYHLTAAGQDIPMPLPLWWTSTLLYTTLALAISLCSLLLKSPLPTVPQNPLPAPRPGTPHTHS